jgi:type II secretory pathway pseudopilin PulG
MKHLNLSKKHFQSGFTYLELVLYITIVVVMMASLIPFAWNIIEGGAKSATEQEVFSQGRYISEQITYQIRNATGITSYSATSVSLSTVNPATSPTTISLSSGNITIQQGSSAPIVPINSPKTTVSSLTFSNHTSADNKTKNIQFVFTIKANYSSTRQEYQGSTTIEGDAELLTNN